MDQNTPVPATPPPTDGLIMPDQPAVTPVPVSAPADDRPKPSLTPVTPDPVPQPITSDPLVTPVAVAAPVSVPVAMDAVSAAPVAPVAVATPEPTPVAAAEPIPEPAPAPTPIPEPENDPLFAPVTEEDPLDVVPEPVVPTPAAPVTDQAMQQLDDGPHPVVASTGQTVVATSKPAKSRRRTMLMLIIGLLLLGGIGYGVYAYVLKPNVSETATPSAILSVDQLNPESLTQATDKAELTAGSQTNAQMIILSGSAPSDSPSGLKLEVEIQPLGTEFTGTPTESTIAVADDTDPLKLSLTNYPAGSYHWRARLADDSKQGPWTTYNTGQDAGKTADFTVDRTAPVAAVIKTSNSKTVAAKTITSTVAQPVLTGTSEAGSTVTVAFNETLSYKATVAADGTWTLTAGAVIPNTKYTLTVTATDAAGNATANTYTFTQAAK